MPKKDTYVSPKNKPPPLRPDDQYRRSIGRQNVKIGRREMKAQKKRADAKKSAMSIQDVVLLMLGFLAVIVGVYVFLYAYLSPQDEVVGQEKMDSAQTHQETSDV
ncbi:triple QxxK/R motif-containing protein-like [Lineus longissimus]|uniref:triple QxxK/R motif-containing protein-like n=1 Tax=Lineus longissimus TaxID=88925 RepID=UPI002B4D1305